MIRNHAERKKIKHICLPNVGCGLDNLQWQLVQKILRDVFQSSIEKTTVCFRPRQASNTQSQVLNKTRNHTVKKIKF